MFVPDKHLELIDAVADGNRSAFMVAAAIERAKAIRRAKIDQEIMECALANAELDMIVYREWECTIADGLD